MALTFVAYAEMAWAAQYSGNAADIIAYIDSVCGSGSASLIGSIIVNPVSAVSPGDWILKTGSTFAVLSNAYFDSMYDPIPVIPPTALALGVAAIPSLNAGATANVDVDIKPAMADTAYTANAQILGSLTLLGGLEVNGACTVIDADTVRVPVHNGALVTLNGGKLLVTAIHN